VGVMGSRALATPIGFPLDSVAMLETTLTTGLSKARARQLSDNDLVELLRMRQ